MSMVGVHFQFNLVVHESGCPDFGNRREWELIEDDWTTAPDMSPSDVNVIMLLRLLMLLMWMIVTIEGETGS